MRRKDDNSLKLSPRLFAMMRGKFMLTFVKIRTIRIRKIRIFMTIVTVLLWIIIHLKYRINYYHYLKRYYSLMGPPTNVDTSCFSQVPKIEGYPFLNVTTVAQEVNFIRGQNIFFHETSCYNHQISGESNFNCRQACAVESAALANPNSKVRLLMLNPMPPSWDAKQLLDTLEIYENVAIYRIDLEDYVKDSPVEQWYRSREITYSSYPVAHMSDMLRLLTLWKFSGIYLDLDVVVLQSLEDLKDFAGAQNDHEIAYEHHIAYELLHGFAMDYRGDMWAYNGPVLLSKTLRNFCGDVYVVKSIGNTDCDGFTIFPTNVFYPLSFDDWRLYYSRENVTETMRRIEQARAMHVWNKLSESAVVKIGSGVPYDLIARNHCPLAYETCHDVM